MRLFIGIARVEEAKSTLLAVRERFGQLSSHDSYLRWALPESGRGSDAGAAGSAAEEQGAGSRE
jgi:hypothetical protein